MAPAAVRVVVAVVAAHLAVLADLLVVEAQLLVLAHLLVVVLLLQLLPRLLREAQPLRPVLLPEVAAAAVLVQGLVASESLGRR